MTGKVFPVTYRLEKDWPGGDNLEYMTFLGYYVNTKDGGEKLTFHPLRFTASGREVAEANAMAFWDNRIAGKQAKKEWGKTLSSKKKNPGG